MRHDAATVPADPSAQQASFRRRCKADRTQSQAEPTHPALHRVCPPAFRPAWLCGPSSGVSGACNWQWATDRLQVEWDASKENALWKILSQAAGGSVDNCETFPEARLLILTRGRAETVSGHHLTRCALRLTLPERTSSMCRCPSCCSSRHGSTSASCRRCGRR